MEKDEFFGSHSCLNWPDSGVLPANHWFQCGFSSPAAPNSGDISIDSHASVEINLKKRKAASTKGMGKEASLSSTFTEDESKIAEEEDGNAKRSKSEELRDAKLQDNPKDYIHVRARRGQATDSHSLAERVRREKISKRMKFLQDLVPGCSKVTGKAVMLDEIINYVQSLQRQVEFLSIKLATVNPRTQEFSMESFLPNDIPTYSLESAMPATYAYAYQSQQLNHLQNQNGRDGNALEVECSVTTSNFGVHLDGFVENATQIANYFEDNLQNVVQNLQIGLGQSQNAAVYGLHHTDHMRI